MQPNKSSIETKFTELLSQMANVSGLKPEQLSKVQKTVIFAHFVNRQSGLQCVDRNGEVISFPQNWHEAKEGVYRFNYKVSSKERKNDLGQKIIQFRLINNQQIRGSVSVNFSVQDSEELHQYQLVYQSEKSQQAFKSYQKNIEEKLKLKKDQKGSNQKPRPLLQPQWRMPIINAPRQPNPLLVIPNRGGGFQAPFTTGEYIGPDNQIFRGRGGIGSPLDPYGNPHNLNDPRRPPGSRFDPIDPFGGFGMDQRPRGGGRDFTGFNQFGQPFGGNRGGFNPGRFM